MKVNWYKFTLKDSMDVVKVYDDIDQYTKKFPGFAETIIVQGTEKKIDDSVDLVSEIMMDDDNVYYCSINAEMGLYAEIFIKKYLAVPCKKPESASLLYGDQNLFDSWFRN